MATINWPPLTPPPSRTPPLLLHNEEVDFHALQDSLKTWREEKLGTSEYVSRHEAVLAIENCYIYQSTELRLDELGLTSIPYEIYNLSFLQILDLRGNQLESLPQGIHKLENLKELILNNNPLITLPIEIFWLENCLISVAGCRNLPPWILAHYVGQETSDHHFSSLPIR